MKDRALFNNYMTVLGEIFDKEYTSVFVETYWQTLQVLTDEEADRGFKRVIAGCKFFPRPVEILEFGRYGIDAQAAMLRITSSEQAHLVLDIISGKAGMDDLIDPVTRYLCERQFNPDRYLDMMIKDEKWFIRDFSTAYRDCHITGVDKIINQERISHTEAKKILRGGSNDYEILYPGSSGGKKNPGPGDDLEAG